MKNKYGLVSGILHRNHYQLTLSVFALKDVQSSNWTGELNTSDKALLQKAMRI